MRNQAGKQKRGAPAQAPEHPPISDPNPITVSGGKEGRNGMNWYTLTTKSTAATKKARTLLGARVHRMVRGSSMTTLVAIASSEVKWLHDCAKDYNLNCQPASAPRKTYQALCGEEMLSAKIVGPHSGTCGACRRLRSNAARAPKAAKPTPPGRGFSPELPTPRITRPAAHAEITNEARTGNDGNAAAPVISLPPKTTQETTRKYLIHDMEARERHAFLIAEEYGNALKGLKAVEASDAALKELQAQLDADRKRLLAFIEGQS